MTTDPISYLARGAVFVLAAVLAPVLWCGAFVAGLVCGLRRK